MCVPQHNESWHRQAATTHQAVTAIWFLHSTQKYFINFFECLLFMQSPLKSYVEWERTHGSGYYMSEKDLSSFSSLHPTSSTLDICGKAHSPSLCVPVHREMVPCIQESDLLFRAYSTDINTSKLKSRNIYLQHCLPQKGTSCLFLQLHPSVAAGIHCKLNSGLSPCV